VNAYILRDLPRLIGSRKCVFGRVEAEDKVERATGVEKAEVHGSEQVQGAMGSSGDCPQQHPRRLKTKAKRVSLICTRQKVHTKGNGPPTTAVVQQMAVRF
jgi:hypothetical protein